MIEINKVFEMFKEMVSSPELKELIIAIQEMYNQKEELQDRIDEAIEYIKEHSNNYSEYLDVYEVQELNEVLEGKDNEI